jgi:2-methylisocitrate lyase-like PEP mutase family enzyme
MATQENPVADKVPPAMSPTRIQRILDQVGAIAFPGVYDTLSAKISQRAGFPMGFVSGYSVAATSIGEPDLGPLDHFGLR